MAPDHSPTAAGAGQAGVATPVGRGRQTTVPSWMRVRAGGSTLAIGGLQQHAPRTAQRGGGRGTVSAVTQLVPRGTQQGGGPVTATATTHPAVVPPPEEGGQQMTTWLRASTGAASPARQPGRLQQQAPSGWVPREDRARSPRHSITGVRRGRSETGDGPSTRPRSRPRHRPPEPSGVSNTNTPPPPLIGILGGRRRATSPPSGAPERPQQRLRVTFAGDTQNQESTTRHGEAPAARVQCPRLSGRGFTLSGSLAIARMRGSSTAGGTPGHRLATGQVLTVGSRQLNTGGATLQNRQETSQRATTGQGSQTEGRGGTGGRGD